KNLDCIFVTEDSKSDWWVQSEGGFQPRMELVEEYRRETQGKTIHLMPLSDLLRLYDVQMEVVDEAKSVEADKKVLAADLAKFTNYTKNIMTLRQFDGYDLEGMDKRSILNLSSE